MTSFFLTASIKSACRKLLLPIGLLAICNSNAIAINHEVTASGLHNKAFATVGGTVTDQNKQPLPGVSVFEKKTKKTTVTDPNGKYSINVEEDAILVFSYIGYDNQEVAVNGRQNINITLKESSNTLNEVVAIGYQKIRKSDVTGAISSVKASEMNLTSPTVGQALVGKVAGVQVSQTSGAPYSGTKIRVRGIGSINASSDPLYVIDGYPAGNNVSINPEDIETIDILKDAASAAIYGSRASGGVVLITTKRGADGKGKFEYDVQGGISQLAKKVKLLDGNQFIQLLIDGRNNAYKDLWVNSGKTWNDAMFSDNNTIRIANVGNGSSVSIPADLYNFSTQQAIPAAYNTDWQDELYRNAAFQRHNLSFSGGTKDVKYFLSGGYQNNDGIVTNTNQKVTNFRGNIDGKVSERLHVGANIAYTKNDNREVQEGRYNLSPMMSALIYLPYLPARDANGNPIQFGMGALSAQYGIQNPENPLATVEQLKISRKSNRSNYNANATYKILEGLNFKANLGTQTYNEKYEYYLPTSLSSGNTPPYSPESIRAANAIAQTISQVDQLAEFTLNYNKAFGKHSIDVLGGYSTQKTSSDQIRVAASGFQNDYIGEITDKGADAGFFTLDRNRTGKTVTTLLSYFGRFSYNYAGKYFLTGSFRRDGSSRFGPLNKYGVFPSIAAGWNLSDESFYNNFLGEQSRVKLRASWGLSGNNNIPDYRTQQELSAPGGAVFGSAISTAIWPSSIQDGRLGWESTSQFNFGTDISLFKNRVSIMANYYLSYSFNLLFNKPLSAIASSSTILTNLTDSKVCNKGFDLQIDGKIIQNEDFTLGLSGNIAANRNKVLDLGGNSTIFTAGAERSYITHVTQEGQPIGMFYGFKVLGRITADNLGKVAPSASSTNPAKIGDLYFQDTDGNGIVNDADKTVIGTPYAKFTYGFALNTSYKTFDLRASFNGSYGNQVLDGQDYYLYNFEGSGNQYVDVADRYRNEANPGSGLNYRASRAGTQSNSTRLSSFYIQDGSYFRCTNITLGYSFPKQLANTLKVSNIRVYASVDNAFTITDYKGYNPEVDYSAGNNLAPGVDYGNYPLARTYNLGIKLTF
ncbi:MULTISPECIES: TonB-dependent receptor [unclassified Pedobacter]|uniref:SusC/RagA family TonB-linked outer membrane protein n=1 Tax=unclassified Pedobacter TaxID=2628915 RepID=UPI001D702105|nr:MULTISPECIES: TonB-dependent receptor [unclassified Pedobacter]CAH0172661.1 TonB-dependent receptor SusC [Pedobacter sp. Bi126]CAH0290039.1 TonB-dependent receptor SusC [Pedobacter sp. Bi36]